MKVLRAYALMESMEFGKKLETLRAIRKASQGEVANAAGCTQASVSRWESGSSGPTLPQAIRIARFLSVPLDYLADDSADEPPVELVSTPEWIAVHEIVRELGPKEAMRRLLRAPGQHDVQLIEEIPDTRIAPHGQRRGAG